MCKQLRVIDLKGSKSGEMWSTEFASVKRLMVSHTSPLYLKVVPIFFSKLVGTITSTASSLYYQVSCESADKY